MSSVAKPNEPDWDGLKQSPGMVLLDFYADWCAPCKALASVLDRVARHQRDLTVVRINIDENETITAKFEVKAIPTLVFLFDGEERERLTGVTTDQVIEQTLNRIR